MRHGVLWTVVLLGLPQVAVADGAFGVAGAPILPRGEPAIQWAEAPASTSPPALDLRIDPTQLPSSHELPDGALALEADGAEHEGDIAPAAADEGLSFGLEVRPRSRIGALAREAGAEDAGLEDQVQKLIERPVFSLRGRYRF